MYFGNYNYREPNNDIVEKILICLSYAKENDLLAKETGCYEINGKDLFVNIVSYETTNPEDRFWEAHKQYLDLHYMLKGKEQIDLNFIHNLECRTYVEEDDFLPLDGEKASSIVLTTGDYLICYPEDAHRTAVKVRESERIKKAIFKIKI